LQRVHFKLPKIEQRFLSKHRTDNLLSFPTARLYRTFLRPVFSIPWPTAGGSGCSTMPATRVSDTVELFA
jgi:hypothetical protein